MSSSVWLIDGCSSDEDDEDDELSKHCESSIIDPETPFMAMSYTYIGDWREKGEGSPQATNEYK